MNFFSYNETEPATTLYPNSHDPVSESEDDEEVFDERLNDGVGEDIAEEKNDDTGMQSFQFFQDVAPMQHLGSTSGTRFDHTEELQVGKCFVSKEGLQNFVREYHINNNYTLHVESSNKKSWVVECITKEETNCPFYLRGSEVCKRGLRRWEITKYRGPHECLWSGVGQGHRQLNASLIAAHIQPLIQVDPNMKVVLIQISVQEKFGKTISYRKAWYAKQKAIANLYGSWEKSYHKLAVYLAAVQKYNPDTIVQYFNPPPDQTEGIFERVFWAFGPCVSAFVHCRPIIAVDGTFLHGKYKGVILTAIANDANNQILPVAFALVESENGRSWPWFLDLLQRYVIRGRDVCLLSDRHPGIIRTVRQNPTIWKQHRWCLRHVRSNFHSTFKNVHLRRLFWAAGTQHQPRKLQIVLHEIGLLNEDAKKWLENLDPTKWTLAHDGGHRYGIMTTNMAEVFNSVMKGVRGLPVEAIAVGTFLRCVNYFHTRYNAAQDSMALVGQPGTLRFNAYSPMVFQMFRRNIDKAGGHTFTIFNNRDRGKYSVLTKRHPNGKGGNTQVVSINEQTCTCGKWQIYQVPCSHVLAVAAMQRLDAASLVSNYYHVETHFQTWSYEFNPLHHPDEWGDYTGPLFLPNPALSRVGKGRPKSARIRNEMDEDNPPRLNIHCSVCHQAGHNKRKCPTRTA